MLQAQVRVHLLQTMVFRLQLFQALQLRSLQTTLLGRFLQRGCFHCENPLSDGERASVGFRPDFGVSGKVCWCWPVEWYYQSAIQFTGITPEEQARLREYIIAVTGEDYPDYSEDGAGIAVSAPEPVQPTPDLGLDDEDGWIGDLSEEELAAAEEDESDSFENKGFNEDSPDDPGSGSPR